MSYKRKAVLHSIDTTNDPIREVEVLEYRNIENVLVKTPDGKKCLAVDNPFTGLLHADDLYRVVE